MIKTITTLTCDRCGREIKAGDRYYVEEVDIFHRIWNGTEEVTIPGEEPEHRECDLCEECRVGLYGPKGAPAEEPQAEELPSIPPKEPPAVAEDVATGETVELDGKTYAEYQPEPETPEPTPETREVAEQIVAMAEKPKRKRNAITDAQKEQIIQMRESGASFGRIADTVGVNAQTAWNIYDRYKKEVQDGR